MFAQLHIFPEYRIQSQLTRGWSKRTTRLSLHKTSVHWLPGPTAALATLREEGSGSDSIYIRKHVFAIIARCYSVCPIIDMSYSTKECVAGKSSTVVAPIPQSSVGQSAGMYRVLPQTQ